MSERLYNKSLKNQDKTPYRHKDLNHFINKKNNVLKTNR